MICGRVRTAAMAERAILQGFQSTVLFCFCFSQFKLRRWCTVLFFQTLEVFESAQFFFFFGGFSHLFLVPRRSLGAIERETERENFFCECTLQRVCFSGNIYLLSVQNLMMTMCFVNWCPSSSLYPRYHREVVRRRRKRRCTTAARWLGVRGGVQEG